VQPASTSVSPLRRPLHVCETTLSAVDDDGGVREHFVVTNREQHHDFDELVEQLAIPHRARRLYWHIVRGGSSALPAVRRGLAHENPDVRYYCYKALDRLVDDDAFPELIRLLDDVDQRVRLDALHALACDHCKENSCRPAKSDVLAPAMRLLREDQSKHVRAMAAEVVGRWVHADASAAAALTEASRADPDPSVRKKAGWYAPGGPIHRKTKPT
jgi:hypothetical protein